MISDKKIGKIDVIEKTNGNSESYKYNDSGNRVQKVSKNGGSTTSMYPFAMPWETSWPLTPAWEEMVIYGFFPSGVSSVAPTVSTISYWITSATCVRHRRELQKYYCQMLLILSVQNYYHSVCSKGRTFFDVECLHNTRRLQESSYWGNHQGCPIKNLRETFAFKKLMDGQIIAGFEKHFGGLKNYRIDRNKLYTLPKILLILMFGSLCGAESWRDFVNYGKEN